MEHLVRVTIIGAGYGGLNAAITLKRELREQIDLVIYERAGELGGTWRESIYPGAAADSPVHIYSLSTNPNPNWSRTHAGQPEILAYMNKVADQSDVTSHIQFNRKLITARWNPSTSRYTLEVEDTTTGSMFTSTCHVLIAATGIFPVPDFTHIPGNNDYNGKLLHTSQWDPELDLRNKKVAIIGNGSSGCQMLPAIAEVEGVEVTQFFRTANWFLPAISVGIGAKMQERFRKHPSLLRYFRYALFWLHELLYLFIFGSSFLRTILTEKLCRKYIFTNAPEKYHDLLVPDYPLGCQRIVFNATYLRSLHRQNVNVVNQPVKRLTDTGLITGNGQYHDFDVVIAATGYVTHLAPLEIHGNKSLTLQEYYDCHGGPEAYMGTMVPGFPNFFILGGPNVATGYMSYLFSIDCQLNLITPLVKNLSRTDFVSYEVTQRAAHTYNRTLRNRFKKTVWNTWAARHYRDPNSGKVTLIFPGCASLFSSWWWTRSPRWGDFLINGKQVKRARVPCSMLAVFAALFLLMSLVLVLVSLDRSRSRVVST